MTKTLARRATKVVSKYATEEAKRLARNERVRIRRAKQRAERRAKRTLTKKAVKRAVAIEAATPARPPHVGIALYVDTVALLVNGHTAVALAYEGVWGERYVSDMKIFAQALGATVNIHDLRVPQ